MRTSPTYFTKNSGEYLRIQVTNEPQIHNHILSFEAEVSQVYQSAPESKIKTQHTFSANSKVIKHRASGNLLVAIKTNSFHPVQVTYGDVLIIPAKYNPVPPPYNPGEFNFRSWLANKNIYQQTFLATHQLLPTGENYGNPILRFSLGLRQRQVAVYRKLIKDDEAFAVASTLLLGYRADLSAETLSAYSKTGTIHALSVSGMHVGIIYLVIEWALQFMNRSTSLKVIKAILILLLIWFYTLLTGCSPSVLRSAIMLSAFVLAKSWSRNTNSYNILAFSAFCLLIYNPFLVWDAGFQLSYLSVFGLIYLQPIIHRLLFIKSKWPEKLWSMVSLSLAAQLATFPLSIYYFHQFPVYFIISNLFITLPVTLLMYIGIILLLFPFQWIADIFEWLIIFNNRGLDYIAHLPHSSASGIWITQTELILLCLLIICLVIGLTRKNKFLFLFSILAFLLLQGNLAYDQVAVFHQRKIILFSLNKNYAVAFVSSDTAIIMTDLKEPDKTFKFSVQPAMDQLKVRKINCILMGKDTVTHNFIITGHQLRFMNFNILRIDSSINQNSIAGRPSFNAVWVQHMPKLKISELQLKVKLKYLWIDATNNNYATAAYQAEALDFNIAPIVLRKNKATLINLNSRDD